MEVALTLAFALAVNAGHPSAPTLATHTQAAESLKCVQDTILGKKLVSATSGRAISTPVGELELRAPVSLPDFIGKIITKRVLSETVAMASQGFLASDRRASAHERNVFARLYLSSTEVKAALKDYYLRTKPPVDADISCVAEVSRDRTGLAFEAYGQPFGVPFRACGRPKVTTYDVSISRSLKAAFPAFSEIRYFLSGANLPEVIGSLIAQKVSPIEPRADERQVDTPAQNDLGKYLLWRKSKIARKLHIRGKSIVRAELLSSFNPSDRLRLKACVEMTGQNAAWLSGIDSHFIVDVRAKGQSGYTEILDFGSYGIIWLDAGKCADRIIDVGY